MDWIGQYGGRVVGGVPRARTGVEGDAEAAHGAKDARGATGVVSPEESARATRMDSRRPRVSPWHASQGGAALESTRAQVVGGVLGGLVLCLAASAGLLAPDAGVARRVADAALFGVGALVASPLAGVASDGMGRRGVIVAGALAWSLAGLVGPLLDSGVAEGVASWVQGAGFASVMVGLGSLLFDVVGGEHLGPTRGWTAVVLAGLALGTCASAWLGQSLAPGAVKVVLSSAGLAAALSFVLQKETAGAFNPMRREGLLELARQPRLRGASLGVACVGGALGLLLARAAASGTLDGPGLGTVGLCATYLGGLALGFAADERVRARDERRALAVSTTALGLLAAACALASRLPGALGCTALLGLCHALALPRWARRALDGRCEHTRGKVMALLVAPLLVSVVAGLALGAAWVAAGD